MDPGWQGHAGTKLHSIQIIKGWVDTNGRTQEAVYPVGLRARKTDALLRVHLAARPPGISRGALWEAAHTDAGVCPDRPGATAGRDRELSGANVQHPTASTRVSTLQA
jgi:Protein of unknown function (DUF3604)